MASSFPLSFWVLLQMAQPTGIHAAAMDYRLSIRVHILRGPPNDPLTYKTHLSTSIQLPSTTTLFGKSERENRKLRKKGRYLSVAYSIPSQSPPKLVSVSLISYHNNNGLHACKFITPIKGLQFISLLFLSLPSAVMFCSLMGLVLQGSHQRPVLRRNTAGHYSPGIVFVCMFQAYFRIQWFKFTIVCIPSLRWVWILWVWDATS